MRVRKRGNRQKKEKKNRVQYLPRNFGEIDRTHLRYFRVTAELAGNLVYLFFFFFSLPHEKLSSCLLTSLLSQFLMLIQRRR